MPVHSVVGEERGWSEGEAHQHARAPGALLRAGAVCFVWFVPFPLFPITVPCTVRRIVL